MIHLSHLKELVRKLALSDATRLHLGIIGIVVLNLKSAPLSKNAVSAFQISCKLLPFTLEYS